MILLTHLKLFFISLNFAMTLTGSVSPVAFWTVGSYTWVSIRMFPAISPWPAPSANLPQPS